MRTSLRSDLTAALRARDRVAIAALRAALAAIDNAESVPVHHVPQEAAEHVAGAAAGLGAAEAERRHLTDADLRAIVANEVAERDSAAAEYTRLGRADAAARRTAEADVLRPYLES